MAATSDSRRTSVTGGTSINAARKSTMGGAPATTTDYDFNLQMTKAKVLRAMDERSASSLFKKFYASDLCDRLLRTLLLYFVAIFQMDWIIKTMERSRKQHVDGLNPALVANRIRELNNEVAALRMDISPIYAELLMKFSSFDKGQQDRQFFETVYETLITVLDEAFMRINKRPDIEREVGAIFRTKHFNLYERRHQPPRSVDTLAVKELYALKHETANRVLNARMLASLFEKPPSVGVTVASVSNSPLISQFISSPIVARSMMKDPEQRLKLVSEMTRASTHRKEQASLQSSPNNTTSLSGSGPIEGQGTSPIPQLPLVPVQEDTGSPEMTGRPNRISITSPMSTEAAGLPLDDSFNFLTNLRRAVKHGVFYSQAGGATMSSRQMSMARSRSMAGAALSRQTSSNAV